VLLLVQLSCGFHGNEVQHSKLKPSPTIILALQCEIMALDYIYKGISINKKVWRCFNTSL